jgi:hypothetical protein
MKLQDIGYSSEPGQILQLATSGTANRIRDFFSQGSETGPDIRSASYPIGSRLSVEG